MAKSKHITFGKGIEIPLSELAFEFSTSGGPGGQHANRASTRVNLLFDIANSAALDEITRARLLEKLANRLTKAGILRINVQDTRSQQKNREIALSRLLIILDEAMKDPPKRRKTKPSSATIAKRLADKKKRSQRKKERRADWSED